MCPVFADVPLLKFDMTVQAEFCRHKAISRKVRMIMMKYGAGHTLSNPHIFAEFLSIFGAKAVVSSKFLSGQVPKSIKGITGYLESQQRLINY